MWPSLTLVAAAAALPTAWEPAQLDSAACAALRYQRDVSVGMNHLGPPGSHVLPFTELALPGVKTVISRHVPKAGSSTSTHMVGILWQHVLRAFNVSHDNKVVRSVRVPAVLNFDHPRVKEMRDAVEVAIVREPLSRFASGYYYKKRYLAPGIMDDDLPRSDGVARRRLAHFVGGLPDNELDLHLFPQTWFLCNCRVRCAKPRAAPAAACGSAQGDHDCVARLSHVLRLENLASDWPVFVEKVVLGETAPLVRNQILAGLARGNRPSPIANAGKFRPRDVRAANASLAATAKWREDTRFGHDAAAFDEALAVVHASLDPNVTTPLCGYLRPDYLALRAYYKPPVPCAFDELL